MKTNLFIAVIITALIPSLFALPSDAEDLRARRDAKIAEINAIYATELTKLQKKAMATGSLAAANEIGEELARLSPTPPDNSKPRLDGSWLVRGGVSEVVRRFAGDAFFDEKGNKHMWSFTGPNTIRVEWNGAYEILTYDPKAPDTLRCRNNTGARTTYERVK